MNTKAVSLIIWIFLVLGAILLGSIPVYIATSFAQGEAVKKVNTAEDLVMMVNTLVGVPGAALIEYPKNVKDYQFVLSSDDLLVFSAGDNELQRVKRTFYLPEGYQAHGFVESEERICFNKRDRRIVLSGC